MNGSGEGVYGRTECRCWRARGRGFFESQDLIEEQNIRRRPNKVRDSWTDSFENVDSFEHEIFAAARTKIVTLTFSD